MKIHLIIFILSCVNRAITYTLYGFGEQLPGQIALPIPPPPPPDGENETADEVDHYTFAQYRDHFNPLDTTLFPQRYFVNKKYFNPIAGNLVFLMVSGETAANPQWVQFGMMAEFGVRYKALIILLEHRFYGSSLPSSLVDYPDALQYLSSEQATCDIAEFIRAMNGEYKLANPKWILFGGSYGGTVAAFARLKFPHLVMGAIASGAPILANVDVAEHYTFVGNMISKQSKDCAENVKNAFAEIDAALGAGDDTISEPFNLCHKIDSANSDMDITTLFRNIARHFANALKNHKIRGQNSDLADMCKNMSSSEVGSPMARVAAFVKMREDPLCMNHKYEDRIEYLKKDQLPDNRRMRQWLFQLCTEFGWHYPSDGNIFGSKFPIDSIVQECADVFGSDFDKEFMESQAERTNRVYGGLEMEVDSVAFVYGSHDPMSIVGIQKDINRLTPVITIEGVGHCVEMYPSHKDDSTELKEVRLKLRKMIDMFLNPSLSMEKAESGSYKLIPNILAILFGIAVISRIAL